MNNLKERVDTLSKSQENIGGVTVALMQSEFREAFKGVYPEYIMRDMFTAVGPMQSFLGYMIAQGHIELKVNNNE